MPLLNHIRPLQDKMFVSYHARYSQQRSNGWLTRQWNLLYDDRLVVELLRKMNMVEQVENQTLTVGFGILGFV